MPEASGPQGKKKERIQELTAAAAGLQADVAHLQAVQQALRESEERYTLAMQGTNEGLWDWDVEHRKVYFSARFKEMLGYEEDELDNRIGTWRERLHPDDRRRAAETLNDHLKGGDVPGRSPGEVAARMVRSPWRRLAAAAEPLGVDATDAELHQLRILTKRCRYAAEAVSPIVPDAVQFAAALADLQTVLGDHQDTVVAEAWLRSAAAALPAARLAAGQLIALERSRRADLRTRWPEVWEAASRKGLRRWL